jgi:hypothetical protein
MKDIRELEHQTYIINQHEQMKTFVDWAVKNFSGEVVYGAEAELEGTCFSFCFTKSSYKRRFDLFCMVHGVTTFDTLAECKQRMFSDLMNFAMRVTGFTND